MKQSYVKSSEKELEYFYILSLAFKCRPNEFYPCKSSTKHTVYTLLHSIPLNMEEGHLKHKDSFGRSENLSKTFHAEILVFHPDYECKSSSSNGQLRISSIYF